MQVEDEGSTSWYEQIHFVGFLHLQLFYILALSPQVTVYIVHGYLLSTHSCGIRILSDMSYGVRVVQTTLSALFRNTITCTGVVVWGFRSSSVAVA